MEQIDASLLYCAQCNRNLSEDKVINRHNGTFYCTHCIYRVLEKAQEIHTPGGAKFRHPYTMKEDFDQPTEFIKENKVGPMSVASIAESRLKGQIRKKAKQLIEQMYPGGSDNFWHVEGRYHTMRLLERLFDND